MPYIYRDRKPSSDVLYFSSDSSKASISAEVSELLMNVIVPRYDSAFQRKEGRGRFLWSS